MKIVETHAKSIITKSKLPDAEYVVNPYVGCSFACSYCYASFMGRLVGERIEAWGSYVYVKTNAIELFEKELANFSAGDRRATMLLSSVTDAWQGPEKKYRLARGILRILEASSYPGRVSILTKSPLITDDLETISRLQRPDVGITVTTTDDAVSRVFEMHAPLASTRLKTLEAFNRAGIPTYAFVGPLFPHFRLYPEKLEYLFQEIRNAGTQEVFVEQINLSPYIRRRLDEVMRQADPELARAYDEADEDEHRRALGDIVTELIKRFGFRLRLARVLDHRKDSMKRTKKTAEA